MEEEGSKRRIESYKMVFEFLKHLTTLSSGSILLILAIAEKFIKAPALSQHLFRSLFLFCISILAALLAMLVLAFHGGGDNLSERAARVMAVGVTITGLAFFGGIALVALSVLRELG